MGTLLQALRLRLSGPWPHFSRDSVSDLDLYLTVAASLFAGAPQPAAHGADEAEIARLYQAAVAASGPAEVSLFGVSRPIDFSQFTPRGHYTDNPALTRYFRAVMWLGLVDAAALHRGRLAALGKSARVRDGSAHDPALERLVPVPLPQHRAHAEQLRRLPAAALGRAAAGAVCAARREKRRRARRSKDEALLLGTASDAVPATA